jgi:hypothetical protein
MEGVARVREGAEASGPDRSSDNLHGCVVPPHVIGAVTKVRVGTDVALRLLTLDAGVSRERGLADPPRPLHRLAPKRER